MNSNYKAYLEGLAQSPQRWLVTGVAGFIGSHLLEALLGCGQSVVGVDNFSTGKHENLKAVEGLVGPTNWQRFTMLEGDVRNQDACLEACEGIDYVLHQAALVSVPRSLEVPDQTAAINVLGFANVLAAAHRHRVRRVVYASSSAVYGAASGLANKEADLGEPLSPYALSKLENELHARMYSKLFGLSTAGLRYFNAYGPRQSACGGYAAVIPLWVEAGLQGKECCIFGDGTATRDFCYVGDIVQANMRAATAQLGRWEGSCFNVGTGHPVTMKELHHALGSAIRERRPGAFWPQPVFGSCRPGDILHSSASIERAEEVFGFAAEWSLIEGLKGIIPEPS